MGFEIIAETEDQKKILEDYKKEVNDGLEKNEELFGKNETMKDLLETIKKEIESKKSLPLHAAKRNFGKNLQKITEYGLQEKFESEYNNSITQKKYPERSSGVYYPVAEEVVKSHEIELFEEKIKTNKEKLPVEIPEELPNLNKAYEK